MAGGNFCVPEGGHCHLVSMPRATPVPHRRKRPHAGQEMRIQTYRVLVVRSANGIRLLSASVLREGGGLATTPFCDSLPLQFLFCSSRCGCNTNAWRDSAGAAPTRQVGGCRWLSSPPLLRRCGQSHGRHSRRGLFVRLGPCSAGDCRNHSNLRLRSFRMSLERQRPERFLRASSPRSTHGIEKRWNRGAICSSGPLTRRSDHTSLRGSIPRRGGRRRFYRPRICDDKSSACLRSTCNDGNNNNTSDATAASFRPRRQDCLGNDR